MNSPLIFTPIFMERIWGGRKLAELFGKKLPADKCIGESWEIVDRPEAQSVVASGPLKGNTLHELWTHHRREVFGESPNTARESRGFPDRFPLLIKLLDAPERLSLQVHPPEKIAEKLGGEPKTECWYIVAAEADAEIFVGFKKPITREQFEKSLRDGSAADYLHRIRVKEGDAMFLPAGRFHGIGGGSVLIEIQQNSDTTYRVFDWNRIDPATDKPRKLHIDQALECIDFNDVAPKLIEPKGELLIRHELFEIQKWTLEKKRVIAEPGRFAIGVCLTGELVCAGRRFKPGDFFLVPAQLEDRAVRPITENVSLLRVTMPRS
jgi:mannose-6-phosphate isomerase